MNKQQECVKMPSKMHYSGTKKKYVKQYILISNVYQNKKDK